MTIDNTELKAMADSMPDLDWSDEFQDYEPTGFCTVYVKPFEIDGEIHDGPTLIERCTAEQAEFLSAAKENLIELLAENYRLRAAAQANESEVQALTRDAERYRWFRDCGTQWADMIVHDSHGRIICEELDDNVDAAIEAAGLKVAP